MKKIDIVCLSMNTLLCLLLWAQGVSFEICLGLAMVLGVTVAKISHAEEKR